MCVLHRQRFLDRHVLASRCVCLATVDLRNAKPGATTALYNKLRRQTTLPTVVTLQHCRPGSQLEHLRALYPHEQARRSAILLSRDPFRVETRSGPFFQAVSFPHFHVLHVHERCHTLARRLELFRALNRFLAGHREWPVFITGLLGPRDELLFRQLNVFKPFVVPDTDVRAWNGLGHTPARFFGQSSRRSGRVFDQHVLCNNMFVYADNRAVAVGHNTMVVGHFVVGDLQDLPFSSGWLAEGDIGPTLCASNRLMTQFERWAENPELVSWLRFVRKRNTESEAQPTREAVERHERRHGLAPSTGLTAQRDRLVALLPSSSTSDDCWRVTMRGRFVLCCARHRAARRRRSQNRSAD